MRKLAVARPADETVRIHQMMMALGRAKASTLLKVCGAGDSYLQVPTRMSTEEEREQRAWLQAFAEEALDSAAPDAEAGFRRPLTPEQGHAQAGGA